MRHRHQQAASSVGAGSGEASSASLIHRDRWIILESFTTPVCLLKNNQKRALYEKSSPSVMLSENYLVIMAF